MPVEACAPAERPEATDGMRRKKMKPQDSADQKALPERRHPTNQIDFAHKCRPTIATMTIVRTIDQQLYQWPN